MKLSKKLIAIPAIALAAGLGLAACGSSGSPYGQGKAWTVQHIQSGDQTSIVAADPESALQAWCAENNPGEGSSWNSGCEAGYFQEHPSDYQSWGPGSTASAATPAPTTPAPTAPAPSTPAPAPAKTVYVQAPAAPAPAGPAAPALTNCGGRVYAGANTSCPFALNVQQAWSVSGATNYITAYSPVTGSSYTMYCNENGADPVVCTGGNNALVEFNP